jgi:subtilisin family serine protease
MLIALLAGAIACAPLHAFAQTSNATAEQPTTTQGGNSVAAMNSQRDIVLAVANPLAPPSLHAGSNLLGYAPTGKYSAGQHATSTLAALKKQYGLHELTGWPIKALNLYCAVLEPPPGMTRDALLATLSKDERVQLAQPLQDYSVYSDNMQDAHRYNDPYVDLQRGFVETDAALAQNVTQGSGAHVAIVDTGIDTTHPDLRGRIADTHYVVDDDEAAFARDSHGTEVAGVIAAIGDNHQGIVGIAPQAELSVYKACWYPSAPNIGARCNSFTLAKALAAIIDTDTRIVNLSLGGPSDPLLDRLLAQLLTHDRIVIAALPPDGSERGFPDSSPGVLVVRSSNRSTAPPGVLSAPGNDILTTQPGDGYDFTSGSSMAAAHVSGIAALILSVAPNMDAASMHKLLLQTSKVTNGSLQVNAEAAVMAVRGKANASR